MRQWRCGSVFVSPHREVDKVLSGLEILSKVFDQQSAFMVSKMIQQVRIFASFCVEAVEEFLSLHLRASKSIGKKV